MMTSKKLNPADVLLPELFDDLMFLVGIHSLETLVTCRLVCKDWNEKPLEESE